MAQASDNTVDNGSGAAVRSAINTRFAALFTNHSGASDTAITTKYPYQTWADTNASQLKLRNAANTAWIPLRGLDGSVIAPAGSETTPSLTFGTDGPDHGFYRVTGTGSSAGIGFKTQVDGGDYTLFTVGKDLGGTDGPSLYWNLQANPRDTSNRLDGLCIQKRGRINIAINNGACLNLNRVGDSGTELGAVLQFFANGVKAGRVGITSATTVELIDQSDRRLKDNITDMPEAKSRINQIQMHRFRMISSGDYEEGFIAQELKEVYPDAVDGTENSVDDEGNIEYMGVAKGVLVPLLMKGLQEAYAEISALTARVEALEAN